MNSHLIDSHVGGKLRQKRLEYGMTQEDLAKLVGVTFQQIQKYEKGQNRVSYSKLYEIAAILKIDISYFFDGLIYSDPLSSDILFAGENNQEPYQNKEIKEQSLDENEKDKFNVQQNIRLESITHEGQAKPTILGEIIELNKYYTKIKDKEVRDKVLEFVKLIATK
jgi:transcriptional regulator with XRE-family HTH domain